MVQPWDPLLDQRWAMPFYVIMKEIGLENVQLLISPIFYKHYVEDIFVLLKSENHFSNLLFYLNCKHPNIRFTQEIEKGRFLAVLDIDVDRGNNKFETTVHRKSTFSGVYTNYRFFIATEYKSSLITTLLYRSFTIVSDYHKLHEDIVKLKADKDKMDIQHD